MKTPLPEPVQAVCVMVSNIGSTHMTPKGNYYTSKQLRAAMVAAYNEAMEDAASAFDPLGEWLGIDEKAYLFAVGIARCIRELKKETP